MNPSEFASIMLTIVQNIDEYEDPNVYHETLVEVMSNAIKAVTA
jgi:hypothetical protein